MEDPHLNLEVLNTETGGEEEDALRYGSMNGGGAFSRNPQLHPWLVANRNV